ncbi:MAG: hypothetical protein ONB23_07805 [candidate division KSB1 bacterium]|nr:hypothetical protein [candidate division KSB1 bacterium]
MELEGWKRLFVWLVFVPGLALTLVYLGFVAWPAIAFLALCLAFTLLGNRRRPRREL